MGTQITDTITYQQPGGQRASLKSFLLNIALLHTYRATGDTDDSAALVRALAAGKSVRAVAGKGMDTDGGYLIGGVNLPAGAEIFGDGPTTVFRSLPAGSSIVLQADSGSATATIDGIRIHDLRFEGRVTTLGFAEHEHLVHLNGVRGLNVLRCQFIGFRGDGLYIGSGVAAGVERHNYGVTIDKCLFDGVNNNNRNGISFTDCNGGLIRDTDFRNCSRTGDGAYSGGAYDIMNPAKGPGMPGPIDLEPDAQSFPVIKGILIDGNRFEKCSGRVGQVGIFVPAAVTALPTNIVISNNDFRNYIGAGWDFYHDVSRDVGVSGPDQGIVLKSNYSYGCNGPFNIRTGRGVRIDESNVWQNSATGGSVGEGISVIARSVKIAAVFNSCGGDLSAVRVGDVRDLTISEARFVGCGKADASGAAIAFLPNTASANLKLRNLEIVPVSGQTIAVRNIAPGHSFDSATTQVVNIRAASLPVQVNGNAETIAPVTFSNGWASDTPSFVVRKNAEGRVFLSGRLAGGDATPGKIMATLPVGYRPILSLGQFPVVSTVLGSVRIDDTGNIVTLNNLASAGVFLDGISFSTGQ